MNKQRRNVWSEHVALIGGLWLGHLRERELWEDLDIYGKIILIFLIINVKIIINMGWEDID